MKVELDIKNISKNSVILARPDIDYFQDLNAVEELHQFLQSMFPAHNVITIPKGLELDIDEWDEIYKNAITYLQSIKPQKGDIND